MLTVLGLILLVPLLAWMVYQRSRRIADDTQVLMRNVLGGRPYELKKREEVHVCPKADDRLCNSLVRHFKGLNAAGKSLRVVAESGAPMDADAIVDAVNARQRQEGKSGIPPSVLHLVFDGLLDGGMLVLREGLYEISAEGKRLDELIR